MTQARLVGNCWRDNHETRWKDVVWVREEEPIKFMARIQIKGTDPGWFFLLLSLTLWDKALSPISAGNNSWILIDLRGLLGLGKGMCSTAILIIWYIYIYINEVKRHDWQLRLTRNWPSVYIDGTSISWLHPTITKGSKWCHQCVTRI